MRGLITAIFILFVMAGVSASAQGKKHHYEAGVGINMYGLGAVGGPSKDFGPGFHFEYRNDYTERVDFGGRMYYKYGKGRSAFTGDSTTWGFVDNHIGLKGVADYNARPGKSVRPYIGAGLGAAVMVTNRTTGENSCEAFGTFGPRVGLQMWRFRLALESDIAFNGRYGILSSESAHSLTLSYTF